MYELRVLTGLHRGAALPLIGNQWLIGADKRSDLTLMDPGVKPMHCQLLLKGNKFCLRSRRGTVINNEGHQVPAIENIQAGESFALNGTWLTLEETSAPWPENPVAPIASGAPQNKRKLSASFWGVSFAAALATTGALASLESEPQAAPAKVENIKLQKKTKIMLNTPNEVKLTLVDMLRERELDTQISVREGPERVYLSGEIPRAKLAMVKRMLNRLHYSFDVQIPIENQVSEKVNKLPFKIVQIISGRLAHVVTDDGSRLFVGDELDGIRLVAIEKNQITFDGTQKFEVKW